VLFSTMILDEPSDFNLDIDFILSYSISYNHMLFVVDEDYI